jgi:hypothetical protein
MAATTTKIDVSLMQKDVALALETGRELCF